MAIDTYMGVALFTRQELLVEVMMAPQVEDVLYSIADHLNATIVCCGEHYGKDERIFLSKVLEFMADHDTRKGAREEFSRHAKALRA